LHLKWWALQWLSCYVQAQKSKQAQAPVAGLLRDDCIPNLSVQPDWQLTDPSRANMIAQGLAAMIDDSTSAKALQDIAPRSAGLQLQTVRSICTCNSGQKATSVANSR